MKKERIAYNCDTFDYWCSDEDYAGVPRKVYGKFSNDGKSYEIFTKDTPRPWLNYLCNDKIASVVANDGLGFFWYKTSLLRVTKYEHLIDYQPRTFVDGRDVFITDLDTGKTVCPFREAEAKDITCIHRPGKSVITARIDGYTVTMKLFVPKVDAGECWVVTIASEAKRNIKVEFKQVWSVARFGIHTAEEGIPYLSIPGKDQTLAVIEKGIKLHTDNDELPTKLSCAFICPECDSVKFETVPDKRPDGRVFNFVNASLFATTTADKNGTTFNIMAAAEADDALFLDMTKRYVNAEEFAKQEKQVDEMWNELLEYPSCEIPEKDVQNFLNTWLKNQIFVTFRYIRSGYIGYRDTTQDSWGYLLVEPDRIKAQILKTLSFMNPDGTCPRNFSPFSREDRHDMRNTMDSATWMGMCIRDYIAETGDFGILDEKIPYLGADDKLETVFEHLDKAMNALWEMRGMQGFCLVKDGDWNDSIEGISRFGPAVSVWLTMAYYHAQNLLADVFERYGRADTAKVYRERNKVLYEIINTDGWDGEWYKYAIAGNGNPVGSKESQEGKIHLNANTWAVFTGLAPKDREEQVFKTIDKMLMTPIGPALLAPPYVTVPCDCGRIVTLEPGTFENGSVYQHAVCFYIYALLKAGKPNEAFDALVKLLPTNPENFDSRRTSEPYCTGNYYCGLDHERQGQNFFTWFTGNAAWLLRAGYDEMLGVRPTFDGLKLVPQVPDSWSEYSVRRIYRGTKYNIRFVRGDKYGITVSGKAVDGDTINLTGVKEADVVVTFC